MQPTQPSSTITSPFQATTAPQGVDSNLFPTAPGPPRCDTTLRPGEEGEQFTLQILELAVVCVRGFSGEGELTATLTSPGGETQTEVVGSEYWTFVLAPDSQFGVFTMLVAQTGEATSYGRLSLVPATRPRSGSLVDEGPPGTVFRIGFAGLEGPLRSYLYRLDDSGDKWSFVSTLPTVIPNDRSEAFLDLGSRAGDRPGLYRVVTDPRSECHRLGSDECPSLTITA
jgi:hypothetical protein